LDEPTGLDPAGMAEMRVLLRRLGSGGRTVLLALLHLAISAFDGLHWDT
jgi:ABC-type multidrug transport system ATPase subunit